MKKAMVMCLATLMLTLSFAGTIFAGQWMKDDTGWWYRYSSGNYVQENWECIDGKWYYFNDVGYMVTDTIVNGYYIGKDGAMLVNTTTDGGIRIGENGRKAIIGRVH